MRAFAAYAMRGRLQAMLMAAVAALLSLILPPVSYVSGAVVALVTLRRGPKEGLFVIAGATAGAAVLTGLLFRNPAPGLAYALILWLPLWLLSGVLRQTISLPTTLAAAGALGLAVVLAVFAVVGDPAAWWSSALETTFRPLLEQAGFDLSGDEARGVIEARARIMTGLMAGVLVLSLVCSLLLARWWQAMLYNPGGFREEFHAVRLARATSVAAAVIVALAIPGQGRFQEALLNFVPVLVVVFALAGLALVHAIVASRNGHVLWLVGLYVAVLFVLPQLVLLLAVLAFADSWLDLRRRWATNTRP